MFRFFSMWFYPLAAIALLGSALRAGSPVALFAAFGAGIVIWTLLEYVVHRWVLHVRLPAWLAAGHGHNRHHSRPDDRDQILVRPLASLVIAGGVAGVVVLLVPNWTQGAGLMAGLSLGFAAYEMIHWSVHTRRGPGRLLARLRRHHFRHHFGDTRRCFGVTTPLWDWLLGTGELKR